MRIEPLHLSHQSLLQERLRRLNVLFSNYSFANLYLFRDIHRYQVLIWEDEIFIQGLTRDHQSFIMLTQPPHPNTWDKLKQALTYDSVLFPVPENWLPAFDKILLQVSFKEADSDYLFHTNKLAHYPGRHLSKKRNLVKQLLTHHHVRSIPFSSEYLADAQLVLDQWQQTQELKLGETDYASCLEGLHLFHQLELHGRLTYVDDQPAGLMIGEWSTPECYVVHFGKALSIKGLYQYLYQDLGQALLNTCQWINLEEDLGLISLKDAKHSYLPDALLHKWRVQVSFSL